ncbi:MAG: hypothetical protein KDB00_24920 [Planctomycetales bacterium]|nr:hypothetical protein [Planctomycetales bacterium]
MVSFIRFDKPYICSVFAIAIAWLVGILMSYGMAAAGILSAGGDLLAAVAVGSGVIAIAGGLPGVVTELLPRSEDLPGRITIGFSAGVLIRLFGTVALVGLCSYHLPAARKEIAGMILAWYVYLTTVDVTVLAMLLPRQDRPAVTRS